MNGNGHVVSTFGFKSDRDLIVPLGFKEAELRPGQKISLRNTPTMRFQGQRLVVQIEAGPDWWSWLMHRLDAVWGWIISLLVRVSFVSARALLFEGWSARRDFTRTMSQYAQLTLWDIRIGGRSQLWVAGTDPNTSGWGLPCAMFRPDSLTRPLELDVADPGTEIEIDLRLSAKALRPCRFRVSLLGRAVR